MSIKGVSANRFLAMKEDGRLLALVRTLLFNVYLCVPVCSGRSSPHSVLMNLSSSRTCSASLCVICQGEISSAQLLSVNGTVN